LLVYFEGKKPVESDPEHKESDPNALISPRSGATKGPSKKLQEKVDQLSTVLEIKKSTDIKPVSNDIKPVSNDIKSVSTDIKPIEMKIPAAVKQIEIQETTTVEVDPNKPPQEVVVELKQQLETEKKLKQGLKTSLQAFELKNTETNQKIKTLEQQKEKVEQELKEKTQTFNDKLKQEQEKVKQEQEKIKQEQEKYKALQSRTQKLEQDLAEIKKKMEGSAIVAEMQKMIDKKMVEITELKQKNNKATQELMEIKKKYEVQVDPKDVVSVQLQLHCKICNKMVSITEVDGHSKICLSKKEITLAYIIIKKIFVITLII